MYDPIERLKRLPWLPVLQAAGVTVLLLKVLDLLLAQGWIRLLNVLVTAVSQGGLAAISLILSILIFVAAMGVGAAAVWVLERLFSNLYINTGILWALVACVALMLFLQSLIPLPAFLIQFGYFQVVGMMLGVFWKGRRYWRYWV